MEIVSTALRSLVAGSLHTSMQAQASSLVEKSNLVALFSSIIILTVHNQYNALHNTKRNNLKISNNQVGSVVSTAASPLAWLVPNIVKVQ